MHDNHLPSVLEERLFGGFIYKLESLNTYVLKHIYYYRVNQMLGI